MPRKAAPSSPSQRRALFARLLEDMQRERDELVARVAELDAELADYGVAGLAKAAPARPATKPAAKKTRAAKPTKKRAARGGGRSGSLKDYIVRIVGPKAMAPADIAAAAVKSGYKSSSKTLPQSVSVACAQLVKAGQLKKEGRGQFRSA